MKYIKLFKYFLNEGFFKIITPNIENEIIDNRLYHVTSVKNAINILTHNYFRTSKGIINIRGLSTTYNINYNWGTSDVKFVLDYLKLKNDYELLYVDEELGFDEFEIKVVSDNIIPNARYYIKNIFYNGDNIILKKMISDLGFNTIN
jgi:hypothetical protein